MCDKCTLRGERLLFVTFIVTFNTKELLYFPFRHEMVYFYGLGRRTNSPFLGILLTVLNLDLIPHHVIYNKKEKKKQLGVISLREFRKRVLTP